MGASVSNQINSAAVESINVINRQIQNCISSGSQNEIIRICSSAKGCPQSNVNLKNISFDQMIVYNTSCIGDVNINSDIQNQISQTFSQAAEAIAQQFQVAIADARNIARVAATIGTTIDNETVQNCINRAAQNEEISIGCNLAPDQPGFCNITIDGATFKQSNQAITNCVLSQTSTQNVINQVSQQIQQKATAKVESIFGPLFAIILIIIIIIVAPLIGGFKLLTNWRFWIVVIVIVLIYIAIAFWRHWFPFEKRQ
jgi:hypothetical protein